MRRFFTFIVTVLIFSASGCSSAGKAAKDVNSDSISTETINTKDMESKSLKVPYIKEIKCADDFKPGSCLLEQFAADSVNVVNWPESYGYAPKCEVRIARADAGLALVFTVTGKDLRATSLEDNGRSWEDSCCEFFICPGGKTYFNIETTCIASVLVGEGEGRANRVHPSLEEVAKIQRWSTLPHEAVEIVGGEHTWSIGLLIPFEIIGMDAENLPDSVGANFYKCGDLTATPHFVTWSPIGTPNPDFHRPEYFGKLILK